jgi:hypothetical protein
LASHTRKTTLYPTDPGLQLLQDPTFEALLLYQFAEKLLNFQENWMNLI